MGVVYMVTCKVNGKRYIGKTSNTLQRRKQGHLNPSVLNRDGGVFHRALHKYGKDAFMWEAVFEHDDEDVLYDKEHELILEYNTMKPNGYNLNTGGRRGYTGHPDRGRKISETMNAPGYLEKRRKSLLELGVVQRVYCVETDTVYDNALVASQATDERYGNVLRSIERKEHRAEGKHYCIATDDEIARIRVGYARDDLRPVQSFPKGKENANAKRIRNMTKNQEFECVQEAIEFYGIPVAGAANISACCHGRRKSAYGFQWELVD